MSARLSALRATLPAPGDLALIGDLIDVRWLTGLQASNAVVLVSSEGAWLITDFRYRTLAESVTGSDLALRIGTDLLAATAEIAKETGAKRLLLSRDHTTLAQELRLAELLGEDVERANGAGLIGPLRAVKDEQEIAKIAAAQELADDAFREIVLEGAVVGRTERELGLALEFAMRRRGAEAISFPPIVAAGAHGARPNAVPRDVQIAQGVLVTIDWGAQLDGYCSDCTRTVATSDAVPAEQLAVHQLVRDAQDAALAVLRAGMTGKAVDAAARAVIEAAGHADHFGHGLGHGVGLEVHEAPNLSPRSQATLAAGHIVTIEPGVYVPGEFGVRVEELAAVTDDGYRLLTALPREAVIVG